MRPSVNARRGIDAVAIGLAALALGGCSQSAPQDLYRSLTKRLDELAAKFLRHADTHADSVEADSVIAELRRLRPTSDVAATPEVAHDEELVMRREGDREANRLRREVESADVRPGVRDELEHHTVDEAKSLIEETVCEEIETGRTNRLVTSFNSAVASILQALHGQLANAERSYGPIAAAYFQDDLRERFCGT